MKTLEIIQIEDRKIVIKGIAKLYFEQGIPISITIIKCFENKYYVDFLKLADEFLKSGINSIRTENTINSAIDELIELPAKSRSQIKELVSDFIKADYEEQREMIFMSLFSDNENTAKDYLRNQLKQITQ